MAVTHTALVRNFIADGVINQLDESSSPGNLVFLTAGSTIVATLVFSNPAFGDAIAGTVTANAITPDIDAVGGTIAKGELRNGDNTSKVLFSVTATGGGGDMTLSSVVISPHQTVSISSMTYTAPA